jgi:hypothetical protein
MSVERTGVKREPKREEKRRKEQKEKQLSLSSSFQKGKKKKTSSVRLTSRVEFFLFSTHFFLSFSPPLSKG